MFNKGKGAGSTKRGVFASGRGSVAKRKVIMTTGERTGLYILMGTAGLRGLDGLCESVV